jgi:DNA-binding Lrp family transcriptional regulator
LLNVTAGSEETVLKQLREIESVKEAYVSYGVYDLVVKVKADSIEALREIITRRIRAINLVQSTLTLILTE